MRRGYDVIASTTTKGALLTKGSMTKALLALGHFNGSAPKYKLNTKYHLSFNKFRNETAPLLITIISLRLSKKITRHFFIGEPL